VSVQDEQEIRERLRMLGTVDVSPAPYLTAVRRGKSVRLRRRVFAAAGAAAVILLGVLVPRLALPAGQGAPRYDVTVHQPGRGSAPGQVAWGTINGKRWQIRVIAGQGFSGGCAIIGQDLECGPAITGAAQRQVSFTTVTSGGTQFQLAAVGAEVTRVVVTLGNGTTLDLRPTSLNGKRWVGFAAPTRLPVRWATSFAGQRELGYAIPYNGTDGATFVSWLSPGQRGAARVAYRVGSGTLGGASWSASAYDGPWGVCVESVGAVSWCAPSAADVRPAGALTSYLTCSPGSRGVWFAATAGPDVATVRFSLSDGSSLRVPAAGIGSGSKVYVFAVANGVRLLRWTALDAAGKKVGSGPGWTCG
jgi:hypothetical protein